MVNSFCSVYEPDKFHQYEIEEIYPEGRDGEMTPLKDLSDPLQIKLLNLDAHDELGC